MGDPVFRQLDYLAQALGHVEDRMIDPVQFGEMRGAFNALKAEVDSLKLQQIQMDQKLDQVLARLSEAKGGWRLLMLLGGAAASAGGAITWFLTHTISIGPKP